MNRQEKAPENLLHPAAWGMGLYLLISVARLPELFPFLAALKLGKVAILLAIVGFMMNKTKGPSTSHKIKTLVVVFAILAVISVAFSLWGSYTIKYLTGPFLNIILAFFLFAASAVNMHTLKFYGNTLMIAVYVLGLKTLLLDRSGRLSVSDAYDPNDLAMILITCTGFLIPLAMTKKGSQKTVLIVAVAIALFAAILTQSRGGFIGIVVVALYFAVTNMSPSGNRQYRFPSIKVALVASIAIVGVLIVAPSDTRNRLLTVFSLEEDYNVSDSNGRIEIWKRGLETMASRPQGAGLGVFFAAEGQQGGKYKAAHNSFIQVGVELGVLGGIVFILFFVNALKTTKAVMLRARSRVKRSIAGAEDLYYMALAVQAALVGYFVTAFFLSQAYNALLYVMLAFSVATNTICNATSSAEEDDFPRENSQGVREQRSRPLARSRS